MFAQVVFPLPFRNEFTYKIPADLLDSVAVGVRVVVPFGRRTLTGFVVGTSETTNVKEKIKNITDVLDRQPIFDAHSIKFYKWVSDYYLSSLGEALRNSVPYGSDIESKRKIISDKIFCSELLEKEKKKTSIKAKLLKILSEKDNVKIGYLQKLVGKKNIYSTLRALENEGAVTVLDEIEGAKVGVKKAKHVKLAKPPDEIYDLMPEIERTAPKQVVILLELISLKGEDISQAELLEKTKTNASSIKSLESKE